MGTIRVLSNTDVRALITPREAVDLVEQGFRLYAADAVLSPATDTRIEAAGHGAFMAYLAWLPEQGLLGGKLLSAFDHNEGEANPFVHALTTFHDASTGRPLCLMNGGYLTALRTGAAAAVATKYLARPNVATLGILGAGLQAGTNLATHLSVRVFQQVLIWSRRREQAEQLAQEVALRYPALVLRVVESVDAVLAEADVVCSTTRATTPLFGPSVLRAGTHVNVIGPLRPGAMEVAPELMQQTHFVVDSLAKFMSFWRSDAITPPFQLAAVMTGTQPGRSTAEQVTVFKPVGLAFEDVLTAGLVYQRACEGGVGATLDW